MKRKILIILGLSLLLFSVSSAGGYDETQTLPAWGKIKPTDIRSIIEQLPPGADHILIYVADDKMNDGVNYYFIPWQEHEPSEINNNVIPFQIPRGSNTVIRDIVENTNIGRTIRIKNTDLRRESREQPNSE